MKSKNKKLLFLFLTFAVFLVFTALLRALNIYYAEIYNDVVYTGEYVSFINILHDILLIAAYGFSVGCVFVSGAFFRPSAALSSAALMTLVKAADSAFSILWDVSSGAISSGDAVKIATAVEFAAFDTAIFAAAYIAAALAPRIRFQKRRRKNNKAVSDNKDNKDNKCDINIKEENKENKIKEKKENKKAKSLNADTEKGSVNYSARLLVPIITAVVFELVSPVVLFIGIIVEYGDPTSVEILEMARDVFTVILKYGILMYAFAWVTYRLSLHWRKESSSKTENSKNGK